MLKILSCPLFCLCGEGRQRNTGPSTSRSQDFALVGSNKARFQTFTLFALGKHPGKAKNINAVTGQNRETNTQVTGSSPAKTQKRVQLGLLRELRILVLAQAKDAFLLLISSQDPRASKRKGKH